MTIELTIADVERFLNKEFDQPHEIHRVTAEDYADFLHEEFSMFEEVEGLNHTLDQWLTYVERLNLNSDSALDGSIEEPHSPENWEEIATDVYMDL